MGYQGAEIDNNFEFELVQELVEEQIHFVELVLEGFWVSLDFSQQEEEQDLLGSLKLVVSKLVQVPNLACAGQILVLSLLVVPWLLVVARV